MDSRIYLGGVKPDKPAKPSAGDKIILTRQEYLTAIFEAYIRGAKNGLPAAPVGRPKNSSKAKPPLHVIRAMKFDLLSDWLGDEFGFGRKLSIYEGITLLRLIEGQVGTLNPWGGNPLFKGVSADTCKRTIREGRKKIARADKKSG